MPLGKGGFTSLVRWQAQELVRLGVTVLLNKEVSAEEIRTAEPDVVLVASGSQPLVPPVDGLKDGLSNGIVVTVQDVLAGKASAKGRIAVIGGGLVGAETAEWLAAEGNAVTLVEMQSEIVKDGVGNPKMLLIKSLHDHGVTVMTDTKVLAVDGTGMTVEHDGLELSLNDLDVIILAAGVRPYHPLAEALADYPGEVRCIGDAAQAKNGYRNIQEAFETGLAL